MTSCGSHNPRRWEEQARSLTVHHVSETAWYTCTAASPCMEAPSGSTDPQNWFRWWAHSPANILFLPPLDPGMVTALIPTHLPWSHACCRERGACRVLLHAHHRALRGHKPRSSSLLTTCISGLTAPLQLLTVSHPISYTLGSRTAHLSSSPGCQEHQQTHTPNSFAPGRAPCLTALLCSGQSCRKPTAAHGQQQSWCCFGTVTHARSFAPLPLHWAHLFFSAHSICCSHFSAALHIAQPCSGMKHVSASKA